MYILYIERWSQYGINGIYPFKQQQRNFSYIQNLGDINIKHSLSLDVDPQNILNLDGTNLTYLRDNSKRKT